MKLVSWNVNGIRAILKKGFLDFVKLYNFDIICLQETKAAKEQVPKELLLDNFNYYFSSSKQKGYSGVCLYSRKEPNKITILGEDNFDSEGRGIIAHYDEFILMNCYFPNSRAERARLAYKLNFSQYIEKLAFTFVKEGNNVVICGDLNIAHTSIDLSHPEANRNSPGFYVEESTWIDNFIKSGYHDTFRIFNDKPGNYTWWSYRTRARERNIGWRIDYFLVNEGLKPKVSNSLILHEVMGSDHCPVTLEIDI